MRRVLLEIIFQVFCVLKFDDETVRVACLEAG